MKRSALFSGTFTDSRGCGLKQGDLGRPGKLEGLRFKLRFFLQEAVSGSRSLPPTVHWAPQKRRGRVRAGLALGGCALPHSAREILGSREAAAIVCTLRKPAWRSTSSSPQGLQSAPQGFRRSARRGGPPSLLKRKCEDMAKIDGASHETEMKSCTPPKRETKRSPKIPKHPRGFLRPFSCFVISIAPKSKGSIPNCAQVRLGEMGSHMAAGDEQPGKKEGPRWRRTTGRRPLPTEVLENLMPQSRGHQGWKKQEKGGRGGRRRGGEKYRWWWWWWITWFYQCFCL